MVIPCIDMKIILIGAGNLATRLAVALQKKGMTPAYIYSRTRESAEQLSERLHDVPHSTDISQVPTDGDLYIFAVKDSALLDLVSRMPSNRGLWVHTAGSMDMEVFAPYTARYGVFYPMQTFSKERVRGRFGAMDEPAEDFVRETLGIPEEMGVLCILSIGHKDEERKPFDEEKMMWEKVHIGKW